MSEQPEALRLANEIIDFSRRGFETEDQARLRRYKAAHAASAELRRLHALCDELGRAFESIVECCEEDRCARDYASRQTEIRGISRAALAKWKESK